MTIRPLLALLVLGISACADPPAADPTDPLASSDFDIHVDVEEVEPTVVVLAWSTDLAAETSWVEFGTSLDRERITPLRIDGTDHVFRLVGLPPTTEVFFRAVSVVDGVEHATTGSVWTLDFDADLPGFHFGGMDPSATTDDAYLLGSLWGPAPGVFLLDRMGQLLWFHRDADRMNPTKIEVTPGSGEIYSMLTPQEFGTVDGVLRRFSIADGSWEETSLPGGAHHAFTMLPDGSVAYIAADIRGWTNDSGQEEMVAGDCIQILSPDGDLRQVFTVWDWLEPTWNDWWDQDDYFNGARNWTHSNALAYDANTDTLLLSMRNLKMLVEVDAGTGEPVRWFGDIEDYWFADGSRTFRYQHDPGWTPTGTILMLSSTDAESVAVEYRVDEDSRELEEVWSYGDGLGFKAGVQGGTQALENGNRLVDWGSRPSIREITPDGRVVWDISITGTGGIAGLMLVPDIYPLN